jgi:hypothetical protein
MSEKKNSHMKKFFFSASFIFCLSLVLGLSGCIKDEHACSQVYTLYQPVYISLTEVRTNMKSSTSQEIEQPGKLYIYGKYIFLNELHKGIHVIDNSNPSSPKNISFIPVPGNVDIAVKGDYLYADSYTDLVVFDISIPTSVTAKKFVDKVFQNYGGYWGASTNPDSVMVVTEYRMQDTVMNCEQYGRWEGVEFDATGRVAFASAPLSNKSANPGTGGSMARFTIVNNYLYTVTYSELFSFDISTEADPQLKKKTNLNNWGIETIFPFKDKLFIGSNTGMYIYKLTDPASPELLGQMSHVRSCDPVIADDKYAYVTLRSGTVCQGFTNQLDVLDISNLTQPSLLKTYEMTNPHGLSKDGDLLFICDGNDGLKVFNASDVSDLRLIKTIGRMETYDVIAYNGVALVVARDGLYQYDYSNSSNIKLLSKLSISK